MVTQVKKDKKVVEGKKKVVNEKVKKQESLVVFEQELQKIPEEYQKELRKKQKVVENFCKELKSRANHKYMGVYLSPEFKQTKQGQPQVSFENIKLSFLFDDLQRSIGDFNPEFFFGNDFDKFLDKKVENKSFNGESKQVVRYVLKEDKSIEFRGVTISQVREECSNNIYDEMKGISNSIVYDDKRNFILALKSIEIHKNMVLQKFEKYVVVVAGVGSWLRGEKSNDFDVIIVIDDTDVRRMPRYQVKEQLTKIIYSMAAQVKEITGIGLHIQSYLLTDFWDSLKDAHPVIFTFLRDGIPFYDRGLFNSWKELLKLGKIRPSAEAIDMHMNVGNQLISNARNKLKGIILDDLFYAVMNPAQAIIMLKGYNPTTPKETSKLFKEVLLEKEKLITKKEYDTLEKARELFKSIEHNYQDINVSGKEIDDLIKSAESYLKKIKQIFEKINSEKNVDSLNSIYNEVISHLEKLEVRGDYLKSFEKFVKDNSLPNFALENLREIIKTRKDLEKGKITDSEINKTMKAGRTLLLELRKVEEEEILERERDKKIIIRYENSIAEIFDIDQRVYMRTKAKSYVLKKDKFEECKEIEIELSKLRDVEFGDELFKAIKKLLGVEKFTVSKN